MMKRTWLFPMTVIAALAVAAFAFGSADAWAQGATPAPLSKVTVSDEAAKRTLMKAVINADTARVRLERVELRSSRAECTNLRRGPSRTLRFASNS